jgi:hypothetical protein
MLPGFRRPQVARGVRCGPKNSIFPRKGRFVWWELGLGAAITLLAAAALTATRRRGRGTTLALRLLAVVLAVVGAAAVARSFRDP